MSRVNTPRTPDSGTTSPTGRGKTTAEPAKVKAGISESAYLADQAAMARKAVSASIAQLKHEVMGAANPTPWIKTHPLATLASAAIAGFASGATLFPSKQKQALDKLRAIERAIYEGKKAAEGTGSNGNGHAAPGGLGASLVKEAMGLLKPVLLSMVSAKIAQPPEQPDAPVHDPADVPR